MAQTRGLLRVDVKGIKRLARKLRVAEEIIQAEVGKALHAEARQLIEIAASLVPRDTDALYRSRFVSPPIRSKEGVKVICGFGTDSIINSKTGKPTSQYAIYVHERLDLKHPKGQAKFLEQPALELAPKLERNLASRIAARIGR